MTTQSKAAELAARLEKDAERLRDLLSSSTAQAMRKAAALLRASEGRVPDDVWRDAQRYRFVRDADRSDCISHEIGLYAMESLDEYVDGAMEGEANLLTAAPHPPAQQAEPDVLPAPDEKKLCAAITEHILSSDAAGIPAVSRQDFRAGVDFARRYYASPPPHKAEGAEPALVPLTDEQLWANDEIMSLNADLGWHMDTIRMFARAIERAHGINVLTVGATTQEPSA